MPNRVLCSNLVPQLTTTSNMHLIKRKMFSANSFILSFLRTLLSSLLVLHLQCNLKTKNKSIPCALRKGSSRK